MLSIRKTNSHLILINPGKPHKGADIIEPDASEVFLGPHNLKSGLFKGTLLHGQVVAREGNLSIREYHLYQIPVIPVTDLLGDEQAAGLQHTTQLFRTEIPVTVDDQIEGIVVKGKVSRIGTFPQVNSQRDQLFLAQLHIRRKAFGCRSVEVRTGC